MNLILHPLKHGVVTLCCHRVVFSHETWNGRWNERCNLQDLHMNLHHAGKGVKWRVWPLWERARFNVTRFVTEIHQRQFADLPPHRRSEWGDGCVGVTETALISVFSSQWNSNDFTQGECQRSCGGFFYEGVGGRGGDSCWSLEVCPIHYSWLKKKKKWKVWAEWILMSLAGSMLKVWVCALKPDYETRSLIKMWYIY